MSVKLPFQERETISYLEPYLADNGYRMVTSDALGRFALDGLKPAARTVVHHALIASMHNLPSRDRTKAIFNATH